MARAKVFRDNRGNRMLLPSYIFDARDDEPLATSLWSFGVRLRAATGLDTEDGWLELDREKFPHIRTEIHSRGFAHGAATALIFAGPEFDALTECAAAGANTEGP